MLFPYKYVPHQMEKMQKFIDYVFCNVWCKAPDNGAFTLDLFDGDPDLREVMHAFYFADPQPKGAKFFCEHIESIYAHFALLTKGQIDQLERWYHANNDVEGVCAKDAAVQPARYEDIRPAYQNLCGELADFFKGLYSQELLDLTALRKQIGDIDDHYQQFMKINTIGKCPFCGIGDIKGLHQTKREAYDHYLPKGLYPFNSINFQNLVPACHDCNSAYKLGKDPANTAAGRRKAFYPYASSNPGIQIKIDLKKADVDNLLPEHVELECGPPELREQIETWKDLYGIEERYKAKCCGENDGKYWLQQVLDEGQEDGHSPTDFLNTLAKQAAKSPLAESNFLKMAFLEACNRIGLF